ncbi:MAG: nucleotidyltransferase [Chloroflexi bacterium]|nr:nucleotidyltransferase [Chloroflexota bacterium]
MELNDQLRELVSEISPTDTQQSALRDAHIRLRERLMADEDLKSLIVETFLQGSYRRHTSIRPEGGDKPDVDVVVVTRVDRHKFTPEQAMNLLVPFLNRHYPGRWKKKGRSIGIEMARVKLDVVLTSAPSETEERLLLAELAQEYAGLDSLNGSQEWKTEPLWIPDREAHNWQRTHPREQIRWTQEKNSKTNGHYTPVVRLVKWWWQSQHPEQEYPKSYPLEHIVGDCCPDGVTSLAQAFTETVEEIDRRYQMFASSGQVPFSPDRGVPEQNVMKRITGQDFDQFHGKSQKAAKVARQAMNSTSSAESAQRWQQLFGNRYPLRPNQRGYTRPEQPSQLRGGRFG